MSDLTGTRKYCEFTTEIDDVTASSCHAHCGKRKMDTDENWIVNNTYVSVLVLYTLVKMHPFKRCRSTMLLLLLENIEFIMILLDQDEALIMQEL